MWRLKIIFNIKCNPPLTANKDLKWEHAEIAFG